jgi:hypothetical protein
MKTEEMLCIGGPWDGERVTVEQGLLYLTAHVKREFEACDGHQGYTPERVEYRREHLQDGDRTYAVFFHKEGLSLMRALLQGYRRPVKRGISVNFYAPGQPRWPSYHPRFGGRRTTSGSWWPRWWP